MKIGTIGQVTNYNTSITLSDFLKKIICEEYKYVMAKENGMRRFIILGKDTLCLTNPDTLLSEYIDIKSSIWKFKELPSISEWNNSDILYNLSKNDSEEIYKTFTLIRQRDMSFKDFKDAVPLSDVLVWEMIGQFYPSVELATFAIENSLWHILCNFGKYDNSNCNHVYSPTKISDISLKGRNFINESIKNTSSLYTRKHMDKILNCPFIGNDII